MTARRVGAALLGAGVILTCSAGVALASQGHDKPSICHPVEGKGETGYGWNLISPDKASVHIDEASGAGKHTRKDGRTDVYADAAGHCPGFVVVTPTPKPTHTHTPKPSPSVTVTEPTPEPSITPTVPVTPTPEPTPTDKPVPSPSPTVNTPDPTPTATVAPKPTTRPSKKPTASSTTTPQPTNEPATTARRAELAHTGAETWHLLSLGALLTIIGAGIVTLARRNKFGDES